MMISLKTIFLKLNELTLFLLRFIILLDDLDLLNMICSCLIWMFWVSFFRKALSFVVNVDWLSVVDVDLNDVVIDGLSWEVFARWKAFWVDATIPWEFEMEGFLWNILCLRDFFHVRKGRLHYPGGAHSTFHLGGKSMTYTTLGPCAYLLYAGIVFCVQICF